MVELFELIASKPLEFLAGLGISSATIYSINAFIKFIFSFATKKKQAIKERLQNEKLADLVISKLGGAETFIEMIVVKIINNIMPTMNEIKELLVNLVNSEKCPVELKAYIKTILNASDNKELLLTYQDLKNQLITTALESTEQIIVKGKQKIEEEKKESLEDNKTLDENIELEKIEKKEEEISYV